MVKKITTLDTRNKPDKMNARESRRAGKTNQSGQGLKVLFAASEVFPFIKTGGLADVACYLPVALQQLGFDIRIVLPAYRQILENVSGLKPLKTRVEPETEIKYRLLMGKLPASEVTVYFIDIPELFDRQGGPYQDQAGQDWQDNARRFAMFGRIIRLIALDLAGLRWQPEIVHCNDWHTGVAPALLSMEKTRPSIVFSIHNLAYQGDFAYDTFRSLNLPDELWSHEAMEFYGRFAFIKGGLVYADSLITVSPKYAEEIKTAEFGYGLEGLLNHRKDSLRGILNGVDYRDWDPRYDPFIERHYWISNLAEKKYNKLSIQKTLGLDENENSVLFAYISRLNWQKGTDLVLDSIGDLMQSKNVQLVVLGTGDARYEKEFKAAADSFQGRIATRLCFDESLSHRIQAGSDILLMPSRYEPCGLTQLYGLRYGTIPVVRDTGGLTDSITGMDTVSLGAGTATGFKFSHATITGFLQACHASMVCHHNGNHWEQMMKTGMQKDFSWKRSAINYKKAYLELLKNRSLSVP